MPKELPVERFRISCEVEATNLGPTVAQLTKMGLTKVNFELIEDVRAFAKRTAYETSTDDFLRAWIADHPTFKAIEAVNHFESNERPRGAVYPALAVLVEKKVLKKLGSGHYSRADVKHLAAPKKPKSFDKTGESVVLSYAKRNHGRVNTAKMVELFASEGRQKNSVYASFDALMKKKLLKRVGDKGSGQYILLNQASEKKPDAKKQDAVTLNGTSAEAAHG